MTETHKRAEEINVKRALLKYNSLTVGSGGYGIPPGQRGVRGVQKNKKNFNTYDTENVFKAHLGQ